MKKFLLPLASLVVALGVSATGLKKPMAVNTHISPLAEAQANVEELEMNYVLTALYDESSFKVPNFYLIFSNDANSKYDANTGSISAPANTFTLTLDLYAMPDDEGRLLPTGSYSMFDEYSSEKAFGYSHEFSMLNFYDYTSGQISLQLENNVEVQRLDNGNYKISVLVDDGEGNLIRAVYNGPLVVGSSTEKPTVYPQLNKNITGDLNKGGLVYYQGVTDYSNNGVSEMHVFSCDYDKSDGFRITGDGLELCMMYAHKRYNKQNYKIEPGTYTKATNLARQTWYPAREVSYYGVVLPFGSYIRERKNGSWTYGYLKEGTFTIEDNGDGTFKGTLDAVTTLGYTVKVTWSGSFDIDVSAYTAGPSVSDLEDDVLLDFSKLDFGRIYHTGLMGGCRTFVVDLGSPAGKDEGVVWGGDILRMEFLVDPKYAYLESGVYTVVPRRWNSDELKAGGTYEPGSLNKGYFDGNGAQVGTRYAHFKDGSWGVYDMVGPAEEGSVIVETDDHENYKFTIALLDDAGWHIDGYWDKPLQYNYNPDAIDTGGDLMGIEDVTTDAASLYVAKEGNNLVVYNANGATVELFDLEGRLVASTTENVIPVSGLGTGLYIVKANNTIVKVAL